MLQYTVFFQVGTVTKKAGLPVEKFVGFLLVVLAFGILLWQAPGLVHLFESRGNPDSEYTALSLAPGISKTYQHKSDNFVFIYKLSNTDDTNLLYVTRNAAEQSGSYPAVAGATYSDLGLEMKMVSVTPNIMVLQISPAK
ncbi:hypothetical protein [Candidatus Bathycorpusculum sp.]|jgi:hypothetical protein|uniref:hypothetical protein n=1 Tax=Candidatus Bathycorpusculum sp. TaxID=2994959 RepID=UPI00282FD57F|nr:hypothetical protein [Candidatus Termitimicrobium sp.]MCL2432830.1 hypothetical protein [Candidatus Termitimicrobium sp.]